MPIDEPASARARAGGKVILLGEHAVVYGSPAIALGLELGAAARVHYSPELSLTLGGERHVLAAATADQTEAPVKRAFRALLGSMGASQIAAYASLEIPAGAGLGASAALGVALARAVEAFASTHAAQLAAPPGSLARAALAWENVFHGDASGIDTAAAEHGGCLWFTRGAGPRPLGVGGELRVLVALVEPGASTRDMVSAVAERRRADRQRVDHLIDSIADLVTRARDSILAGEREQLGQLMQQNHQLLVELGVSTAGLDAACQVAMQAGALGAKLTGAGGGGCVIALVGSDDTRELVLRAWQARGFACLAAQASPLGTASASPPSSTG
jgi:mevalonate kinase